jgi:tripartite-type tricarboxylate transporter receptor subunit TctC
MRDNRKKRRRHIMKIATIGRILAAVLFTAAAHAGPIPGDDFPSRPIRFVVGFSPGGGTDTVARIMAQKLGATLGQSIVVDNRPGAGGAMASEYVAKSAPDGYTILFVSSSFTIAPNFQKLSFDPIKDFSPVSLVSSAPLLLVVNPKVPVNSVQQLLDMAKARPGKLNYASAGIGSGLHIAGELFKSLAHVDIVHVPYKGAVGISDLLAGTVQMSFAGIPQTIQSVKAGQLRALAVTSAKRSPFLPDIPTIAESGVPGYDMESWYGVVAPAGLPKARLEFLSAAIRRAASDPQIKEQLAREGHEVRGSSPEQFADLIGTEMKKWSELVRTSGIETHPN